MDKQLDQDIYRQLKIIAKKLMSQERQNHTLSPTDLVHEAYIKLNLSDDMDLNNKQYIFVLARQMRRLLVDYGRQKTALKRGGERKQVMYTDALGINDNSVADFSLISDAIDDLNGLDQRAAQAIDIFYFTQVNKEKTAELLNISVPTLERDLRFAKAHISHYLDTRAR